MAQAGFTASPALLPAANGGQNAIAATLAGLFRPGDCIGADPLTYPGLKSAASLPGAGLVPVARQGRELSGAGLRYACKNLRIKGLFVMPDHQNPSTHIMSPACRAMIARLAARYDLIVIEDAIRSLMLPRPQPAIASLAPEHTVCLFSLSKAVSPGVRFSYAAGLNSCRDGQYKAQSGARTFLMSQPAISCEKRGGQQPEKPGLCALRALFFVDFRRRLR